jgi:CBS domain-containing protein
MAPLWFASREGASMRIGQVMTRGLEIVPPEATIMEAATRMAAADIGAILVGSADELKGILTDRDILIRVVVEGKHPGTVLVGDIMSAMLFTCAEDDSVEQGVAEMKKRQVRRLPVIDSGNRPVGIVALSDLARHLNPTDFEQLRRVVEPHRDAGEPRQGVPEHE